MCAAHAIAAPSVVIVETRDAPSLPALAAKVRLHAGRAVEVTTIQDAREGSMTFAARASQIVSERDATVVVWVATVQDSDAATRTFLVFAAGRWPDRALLELVRIDARTDPSDVERLIALKIAGLLDTAIVPRPASVVLGIPADHVAPTVWRVEAAGSIVYESGDRRRDGRLGLMVHRAWDLGGWQIAAGAGAHWQPSTAITRGAGIVSLNEVGVDLAIAGERQVGRWIVFAQPRVSTSWLLAGGQSPRGVRGSATVFSPSYGGDVGVRWRMSDMAEVVLAVGGDAAWIQQRFLVDGSVIADLRRVRGWATLGLSVPLP